MWPNRPTPDVIGWGANWWAGSGSAAIGWSKKPTDVSHSSVSVPRVRRRTRGTRLVERWTVRPASSRSSAIWPPDWAEPTTRTAPGGSWAGFR